MTLLATDFRPWKCPTCKRVVYVRSDATWVTCVGGYILVLPKPVYWHEMTECYLVTEAEADPLELLRAMGLSNVN